uniref:Uncharacterized protein n=1 Tax=Timema tahoe TaxID=61484 RepID=A0A7R9ILV0_9NEOP|nr:unnamed protein product [Timema tahoe]
MIPAFAKDCYKVLGVKPTTRGRAPIASRRWAGTEFALLLSRDGARTQGLRWCVEVGAILTAAGAWLKVVGVSSSSYWLAMLGQTIVGSGGVFVLGMPPKLASLWFGPDQISTACSIIVLGSKLGAALGLSLPPVLVRNHLNRADIEPDLKLLQQIIAGSSTLVLVLIILCYRS